MAAEVCANRGKDVSMGMGVLMERREWRPGNGKGAVRLVVEKRVIEEKKRSENGKYQMWEWRK